VGTFLGRCLRLNSGFGGVGGELKWVGAGKPSMGATLSDPSSAILDRHELRKEGGPWGHRRISAEIRE
jgi:hypothetical protein